MEFHKLIKKNSQYLMETYNEPFLELIKIAKESKKKRQRDRFLDRIQQAKMKELWDNAEDET